MVLLKEVDGEQRPTYFISKTFTDYQIRYLSLEKLVLALAITSRNFMHYFHAYPIVVYTVFPLKNMLMKPY